MAAGLSARSRFGMESRPDDERLREAVVYVARGLEGDRAGRGAVKLNKVLWWADFESYRERGRSVTGAEYQRLPEGPAPVRLLPVRRQLQNAGDIAVSERDVGAPMPETTVEALREPQPIFDQDDLRYLDRALKRFEDLTGGQCSDLSHQLSVGWRTVEDRQVIPYETAILSPEELTEEQLALGRNAAIAAGFIPE